jgi:hypothetical protein
MTKARRLIEGATFDPAELEMIGAVFEELWASMAADYDLTGHEPARMRLANIVLDLAQDRQFGPPENYPHCYPADAGRAYGLRRMLQVTPCS